MSCREHDFPCRSNKFGLAGLHCGDLVRELTLERTSESTRVSECPYTTRRRPGTPRNHTYTSARSSHIAQGTANRSLSLSSSRACADKNSLISCAAATPSLLRSRRHHRTRREPLGLAQAALGDHHAAGTLIKRGVAAQPHELMPFVQVGADERVPVDTPILERLLRVGHRAAPPDVPRALPAPHKLKALRLRQRRLGRIGATRRRERHDGRLQLLWQRRGLRRALRRRVHEVMVVQEMVRLRLGQIARRGAAARVAPVENLRANDEQRRCARVRAKARCCGFFDGMRASCILLPCP